MLCEVVPESNVTTLSRKEPLVQAAGSLTLSYLAKTEVNQHLSRSFKCIIGVERQKAVSHWWVPWIGGKYWFIFINCLDAPLSIRTGPKKHLYPYDIK